MIVNFQHIFKINQTNLMNPKILLLLVLSLIFSATAVQLTHQGDYSTCFFIPLGHLNTDSSFNYTITQAWTAEQTPLLKNGSLNTSDFIHVAGWKAYSTPIQFYEKAAKFGQKSFRKLRPIKDVLHGSDAPQFYLSDADLQFAFGTPSEAKLYKVPSGKALVAFRTQAAVTGAPFIGKWSIFVKLIDDDNLQTQLNVIAGRAKRLIKRQKLTSQDATTALNIIPPFIENSVFWTLSASPAQGTTAPVDYQAYLMVIRGGEQFLAGPIHDGQPGVIQVKDVVKNRSQC